MTSPRSTAVIEAARSGQYSFRSRTEAGDVPTQPRSNKQPDHPSHQLRLWYQPALVVIPALAPSDMREQKTQEVALGRVSKVDLEL
ncbi:hypothetical protein JBE27_23615 [Streptomyces albiflaviniger]|nr:hypothetical protein [Streptomyces albiflaviniger]